MRNSQPWHPDAAAKGIEEPLTKGMRKGRDGTYVSLYTVTRDVCREWDPWWKWLQDCRSSPSTDCRFKGANPIIDSNDVTEPVVMEDFMRRSPHRGMDLSLRSRGINSSLQKIKRESIVIHAPS